jgi:uncharacterized repeat protein (TIGR01451 family)
MASGLYNSNFFFLNKTTGTNVACGAALRIGTQDYFTEDFTGRPFDLQNSTLTLTPAGASYVACVASATNFFVQPTNAIALSGLADDEYRMVALTNGRQVKFYGQPAGSFWIGANGNISPDPGTHTDFFYPGLFEFFSVVRVAPLYVDLNPLQGGRVSWQQLSNRVIVTFEDVPEWAPEGTPPNALNSNNFQIELFYDGIIRITWLKVEASGALVGISRGTSIPADFFSSDLSALSSCVPTGRLVVPAVAREGDGTLQGTVLLSLPSPAPMEVQLSSDNTNEVVVPTSILIPAGEVSANFSITIVDDVLLDGTQVATIQAGFPDRPSATAGIAINDNETTRITIAVPAEAGEGDGVLVDGGFIFLGAPAGRDVRVQLTSSNSTRVIVPSSVIVPAGSSTAFFDVTLVDDELLNGLSEDVSIAASVTGWQYDKDVITVHDNDAYQLGITLISELAENGGSVPSAGAVILPSVTAVPVTISLNSDQPSTVFPPPTITVPAGSGSATFPLFVVNNFNTNNFDFVRIDASAPEFLSATGSVRVLDDERPTAPFAPYPTNGAAHVAPDTALAWTVNPMPIAGTIIYDVYLDTNSNPTTKIGTTTNLLLGLGTQLDSGRTYYWRVVSRRDPFSVSSDVWSFTTAPFDHFSISNVPSPQFVGQPFAVTVTARDEYDKIVGNYSGAVSLTNYVPGPPKGKILITEVDTGDSDRVEFQNVSDQNVNITGWQVTFWDAVSWPAPKITFTVPTTASVVPGDVFRVRTFSARFAPGTYPNFIVGTNLTWNGNPTDNSVAVLLQDSAGNIVDFFCAVDAPANQITVPFPISLNDWSGAPVPVVPNSQTLSYQRQGNMDHNDASDWTYLPTGILVTNTGIQVPFTSLGYAQMISSPFTNFISGVCTGSVVVLDEGQQMYLRAFDTNGHTGSSSRFDVFALNDISVRASAPDNVTINDSFVVSITVTNRGSNSASGVTVSNAVPFGATYVSAVSSRGSCSVSAGTVVCSLGDLAASDSATAAMTFKATSAVAITNIARVYRSDADNYFGNNTAATVTLVSFSQVLIGDVTAIEPFGDLPGSMTFNVSLLPSNAVPVSVQFFTSDGTAAAGLDYLATNGTLVFPPGTTNQTITVTLLPDALSESNETFTVTLVNPTNVLIGDSQATGTINDNDPSPTLTINDIAVPEGSDGTSIVTFSVALSAVSGKISSVAYTTVDGSALAGLDYLPAYGVMTFSPGVTNASVDVGIIGSSLFKPDRKFYFRLLSPDGLILSRTQAVCVVTDKDTNRLHHLAFEAVPAKAYTDVPFSITGTARDFLGGLVTNFSGPVHLLAADNEVPVTVGSNSLAFEYPLGASYHDSRFQTIYLASELGAPGEITSLSLEVTNVPGVTLSNFTIRTKPFVPAQFVTVTWESDGWTTNFQSDVTINSTGWVTFVFRTPCQFDGVTNLFVDFSFNNNSYGSDGLCRSSVVAGMRSIGFRTDSAFGDPLSWSNSVPPPTLFNRIPNTRFTIGRSVAVSPPTISNALAGVFTSPVALNTAGSNMTLRIVDNDGHYAVYSGFTVEILDSDGDGLPDSWESGNGLNPFDSSDATTDADGDGLTNLQEYFAGTDPRATNSTVRIESVARSDGDVTITVRTVLGKRYELQSSTSLPNSWAVAALPVNGTGGLVPIVHRPPTNDTVRFYRVRVLP